ncbi:blue (type 1) copper domain protein [halophilic archaeon DL31]|jgi:plastocyanin|nr:blue (type 1) copper domain protein [halophilic archaeon DL31]
MKRRDFLRATGGSGAAVALGSGAAAGQQETGTATGTSSGTGTSAGTGTGTDTGGGGGSGPTKEVSVGPGGSLVFDPETLEVTPGTTVTWVWESDNHNVAPESTPEGANWSGSDGAPNTTYNTGHEYSHTFETLGTYEYVCTPHASAGMVGSIEVVETLSSGGGGEKELHDLGVPIQAHWVGVATILMLFVTFVFTFYTLKYGESPNTGNTGGGE